MQSLAAALVQNSPRYMVSIIYLMAVCLVVFIFWMNWAEIDIVVRGGGKVNPSRQVQVIQSLEGGVVSEILVREGEQVEINQPLMKISDISFAGSFEENRLFYLELKAKISRLTAEANAQPFIADAEVEASMPELMQSERSLYESNLQQLGETLRILEEKRKQHENGLVEAQGKQKQLAKSFKLISQELAIKKPLVRNHLISEVDYLQLQGREAEIEGELESIRLSIPRLKSLIEEARGKINQTRLDFQNMAKKELNEVVGEVTRIAEAQAALKDRVKRTTMRSSVKGTIQRLHINTIGGVIKPGSAVIEVIPRDDALLVELKIKPSDIADISVGQLARIKFTAYDFAIYGSLEGKVEFISADTITNEEGESYFFARIRPVRPYLGHEKRPLPIKVGMVTEVDIITGKKTILQYLLKPIIRGMDKALGET